MEGRRLFEAFFCGDGSVLCGGVHFSSSPWALLFGVRRHDLPLSQESCRRASNTELPTAPTHPLDWMQLLIATVHNKPVWVNGGYTTVIRTLLQSMDRQLRAYASNLRCFRDCRKLRRLFRKHGLLPEDIFNIGEKGFIIGRSARAKVICRAGRRPPSMPELARC